MQGRKKSFPEMPIFQDNATGMEICEGLCSRLKSDGNWNFHEYYIGGTGRGTARRSRDADHRKRPGVHITLSKYTDINLCADAEEYCIKNLCLSGKSKTNVSTSVQGYQRRTGMYELYIKLLERTNTDCGRVAANCVSRKLRSLERDRELEQRLGIVIAYKPFPCRRGAVDKQYHPSSDIEKEYFKAQSKYNLRYARSLAELREWEPGLLRLRAKITASFSEWLRRTMQATISLIAV